MMMKKLVPICFFVVMSTYVGCSTAHKKQKNLSQEFTPEQLRDFNQKAKEKVSERLKELADAAKSSGDDKVQFLASDMYLKASAAVIEGDYATANLIFERLVELVSDDEFIKKKYAISLIRTGDLEKAKILLEKIFKQSKDRDEKVGLILAGVYSSLGDSKSAETTYARLLDINPNNEDACIFLAKTHSVQDKFDRAIAVLNACDKRMKKNAVFSYYIGKMYIEKNKFETAENYFKRSQQRDPSFGQAVMALGLIKEEKQKFQQAIKIYQQHLEKYPNDMLILSRIVQLLFTEEKFADVIPYAERLSDLEPDNLNLKVKLGILYTDNSQYEKAIATFKELLSHAPDNDKLHYYIAAIYQETGELEKSIEYYSQIPMGSALFQDSSVQMAQILSALGIKDFQQNQGKQGHHKKFISFIEDRIGKLPALEVEFRVIEAGYFESIENYKKAIASLSMVSQLEDFKESHQYYLASLYEKDKRFDKSTDLIMAMLEKDPRNAHAWNFLGYSLLERGVQISRAHEFIVNALAISPNDGYIRDSLGWYYFKIGENQKALKELEYAVKSVPKDVSIQKHLAIVYTHLKDFDSAKKWIVEAMKNVQIESERKELMNVLKELEVKRIPASFKFSFDSN